MLDLPGFEELDKTRLIGACMRLPLRIDWAAIQTEVRALPDDAWSGTGGRVGVHQVAQAIFLRGHAPAEGNKPIEDRSALSLLPEIRALIKSLIPAEPQRSLLARLPPERSIALHIDRAPYFGKTIRIHVPIETHADAWMICSGLCYRMNSGEVWALNNTAPHGVLNLSPTAYRTHLICDFLPSTGLFALLKDGERDLGATMPHVLAQLPTFAADR